MLLAGPSTARAAASRLREHISVVMRHSAMPHSFLHSKVHGRVAVGPGAVDDVGIALDHICHPLVLVLARFSMDFSAHFSLGRLEAKRYVS